MNQLEEEKIKYNKLSIGEKKEYDKLHREIRYIALQN
jgi:hypothetical protein